MSNSDRLISILGEMFGVDEVEVDAALIDRMISALEPVAADDIVCLMAGTDDSFVATSEGLEGLRGVWADWLGTFASVRFEIESMDEVGENVVVMARQIGTTRHGGVEISQPSAALWKFRDGVVQQVEFHLDRDMAMESARKPA